MKGFTLVELMIVFVVLSILTGGAIIRYNAFNRDQSLKQSALNVRNDLRLAQVKASSSLKPSSGCTSLEGYAVTFAVSSYSVQAQCSEGLVGAIHMVSLPSNITFNPVPSIITFPVLNNQLDQAVTIALENSTRTYVLTLRINGDITDEGFQ